MKGGGGGGDDGGGDGGRISRPSQTPSHHAGISYPVRVQPLTPICAKAQTVLQGWLGGMCSIGVPYPLLVLMMVHMQRLGRGADVFPHLARAKFLLGPRGIFPAQAGPGP